MADRADRDHAREQTRLERLFHEGLVDDDPRVICIVCEQLVAPSDTKLSERGHHVCLGCAKTDKGKRELEPYRTRHRRLFGGS